MENQFAKITDKSALEELMARSADEPVIVFKHSNSCSLSAMAFSELAPLGKQVNLIEVQSTPSLSQEIEKRTGLQHQSPQVIVLRQGKAVWDASHFKIKIEAVRTAVSNNA